MRTGPDIVRPTIVRKIRSGFTLIELLMTMAVVAVLLGIGLPMFQETALRMSLSSYANNIVAAAYGARSEAIKRNTAVSICASKSGTSCDTADWAQGWIIMCPTSDNIVCDPAGAATLVISRQEAVSSGWRITEAGGASVIAFRPSGMNAAASILTVCRVQPSGDQERVIRISATGRPSVTKTSTGICP